MNNVETAQKYLLDNVNGSIKFVRVIQDKNMVVLHSVIGDADSKKVAFDVFEFNEQNQIQKHYYTIENLVDEKTPSGHTQIDGPTEINKGFDSENTKQIIRENISNTLLHGPHLDMIPKYFGDTYIQHHVGVPDGVETAVKGMTMLKKLGKESVYDEIEEIIAQGDFGLIISKGHAAGVDKMYYDLFRVDGKHIVEHWDIVIPINDHNQVR